MLEIVHRSRASLQCRKCGYKTQLQPNVSVENKKSQFHFWTKQGSRRRRGRIEAQDLSSRSRYLPNVWCDRKRGLDSCSGIRGDNLVVHFLQVHVLRSHET